MITDSDLSIAVSLDHNRSNGSSQICFGINIIISACFPPEWTASHQNFGRKMVLDVVRINGSIAGPSMHSQKEACLVAVLKSRMRRSVCSWDSEK